MGEGTHRDLFERIRQKRDTGNLTLAVKRRPPDVSVEDAADAIAAGQGFVRLGERWREIEEAIARKLLTKILHRDLAYGTEVMSVSDAEHLAAEWMSLTSSPRSLLTNGNWEASNCISWDPLTPSTFDAGLVVVDNHAVTLFWVEDED